MDRDLVYAAIDSERDFQDAFLADKGLNPNKTVGEFLTLIRTYSSRADYAWTGSPGDAGALEDIRKIAAICVSCLEKHGATIRPPYLSRNAFAQRPFVTPARRTPFQNINWNSVVSSNIQSVRYDPNEQILQIRFRDSGVYEFTSVPQNVYNAFVNSASKGKFFHANIRGTYTSQKVG